MRFNLRIAAFISAIALSIYEVSLIITQAGTFSRQAHPPLVNLLSVVAFLAARAFFPVFLGTLFFANPRIKVSRPMQYGAMVLLLLQSSMAISPSYNLIRLIQTGWRNISYYDDSMMAGKVWSWLTHSSDPSQIWWALALGLFIAGPVPVVIALCRGEEAPDENAPVSPAVFDLARAAVIANALLLLFGLSALIYGSLVADHARDIFSGTHGSLMSSDQNDISSRLLNSLRLFLNGLPSLIFPFNWMAITWMIYLGIARARRAAEEPALTSVTTTAPAPPTNTSSNTPPLRPNEAPACSCDPRSA